MTALRTASAIVIATGIVTLGAAFFLIQNRLARVRRWKAVDAEVVRAWMEENPGEENAGYTAHYELAYRVDGKPLRTTARSGDFLVVDRERMQARLDRHAPGTHGSIYVNPDDPSQVSLNLGRNAATFGAPLWVALAGAALLLIGVSLWLMGTPGTAW
jgi:hypothetical protein